MRILLLSLLACALLGGAETTTESDETYGLRARMPDVESAFRAAERLQLDGDLAAAAEAYRAIVEQHRYDLDWSTPALVNLLGCLQAIGSGEAQAAYLRDHRRFMGVAPDSQTAGPVTFDAAREALLWTAWLDDPSLPEEGPVGLSLRRMNRQYDFMQDGRSWNNQDGNEHSGDIHALYVCVAMDISLPPETKLAGYELTVTGGDHEPRVLRSSPDDVGDEVRYRGLSLNLHSETRIPGPFTIAGRVRLSHISDWRYHKLPLSPGSAVTTGTLRYRIERVEGNTFHFTREEIREETEGEEEGVVTTGAYGYHAAGPRIEGPISLIDRAGRIWFPQQDKGGHSAFTLIFPGQAEGAYLRIREERGHSQHEIEIRGRADELP